MSAKKKNPPVQGDFSENRTEVIKMLDKSILTEFTLTVKVGVFIDGQLDKNIKGPGIYVISSDNEVIYVGLVSSPNRGFWKRLSEHFSRRKLSWETPLGHYVVKNLPASRDWDLTLIGITSVDPHQVEIELIKSLQPVVNTPHNNPKRSNKREKMETCPYRGWDWNYDRRIAE